MSTTARSSVAVGVSFGLVTVPAGSGEYRLDWNGDLAEEDDEANKGLGSMGDSFKSKSSFSIAMSNSRRRPSSGHSWKEIGWRVRYEQLWADALVSRASRVSLIGFPSSRHN
jgi:hypothetical protein